MCEKHRSTTPAGYLLVAATKTILVDRTDHPTWHSGLCGDREASVWKILESARR